MPEAVTFNEIGPFCTGSSPVNLFDQVSISTGGDKFLGTFSGAGVSSGIFYPGSIDNSGDYIITYSYPGNGCTIEEQITVEVNKSSNITQTPIADMCRNDSPIDLNDYVVPSGGIWTGVSSGSGLVGSTYDLSLIHI